ncbi:dienelactone hydrolase endo-1,3,1,4-beta-D-glucanase [Crassisporium funariophilum]|nr:dienelactone hydrolase endo-1,3,1,4-beta-D-glucanase [Crassisporium funariophilum]
MTCPRCAEGVLLAGEPTGSIKADFQGAYYAPGPGEGPSKRAVLYLTDAFGMPLKNCKIMADEMAKHLECDVWIPDYFNGRPLLPVDAMAIPDRAGVKISWWQWVKFIVTIGIPNLPAIISNTPSVVDKRIESFITLLQEKRKYEKIGAVGYCFGGSTCVRLGGTNLVNSVIICHPGRFTLDEVKAIKVPAAWVCAEDDIFFADSLRNDSEAVFAARKDTDKFIDYEFVVYKGTAHGFATRPNLELPEIKQAYEDAFSQVVEWFRKTLVV